MYSVSTKQLAQTLLVSTLAVATAALPTQASSLIEKEAASPETAAEVTEKPAETEPGTVPAATPVPAEAAPIETPMEVEPVETESPEAESPEPLPEDGLTETPEAISDEIPVPAADPAAGMDGTEESTEPMAEPSPTAEEPLDTSVLTVVEVAGSSDAFETLTAALEAAGLAEDLSGEGPFTVFAPTDEAFAALPDGTLEALLLPENQDTLVQILTYHVLPEAVVSTDLAADMDTVMTVEGSEVTLSMVEDNLYEIGRAHV